MFERLDDAEGFSPPPGFHAAVMTRGTRLRRRRGLAMAATGLFAALVVLAGGVAAYGVWKFDHVERIDAGPLAPDEPGGGTVTFVIVGEDGSGPGARADIVVVVRYDPASATASVLSVPRDLWLDEQRVSAIYSEGGAPALLDTLARNLDVHAAHFMALDFEGSVAMVDAVGGVDVAVDEPVRDRMTGLALPAGCSHLDGEVTLSLVRSRHLEAFDGTAWQSDPTADFGRISRQQAVAQLLLGVVQRDTTITGLYALADAVVDHVTIDSTMSFDDLVGFIRAVRAIDPAAIDVSTVPSAPYMAPNGAAVLRPVPANQADQVPRGIGVHPCSS